MPAQSQRNAALLTLLALVGSTLVWPGQVLAQPMISYSSSISYGNPFGGGQPRSRYPADFDWDAIDDAGPMSRRGGAGAGGVEERPLVFKSDVGKAIQRITFARDQASVLAARTKLAQQWREFTTTTGPIAPEPDKAGPGGAGGMGALGGMGAFGVEMGDMGAAAMMEMAEGMDPSVLMRMAAGGGMMPGGDSTAAAAPEITDAAARSPAAAAKAKAAARQRLVRQLVAEYQLLASAGSWAQLGEWLRYAAPEDAEAIYTHMLVTLANVDQAAVPGDIIELSEIAPPQGGYRTAVGSSPADFGLNDGTNGPMGDPSRELDLSALPATGDMSDAGAAAVDTARMAEMARAMAAMELGAAPAQPIEADRTSALSSAPTADGEQVPFLSERQIKLLGQLLAATAARGGEASAVAARIRQGTTHFGGPEPTPESSPENIRRAQSRKNAATLLMAAGLTVDAQPYLAPLALAKANQDTELLNLYITYFDALAKKKQGAERREIQLQGWQVAMDVLASPVASIPQRSLALAGAMKLIEVVDKPVGDAFLAGLFAQPTGDQIDLGWSVLQRAKGRAFRLKQMMAPPEVRARQLTVIQRVGQALLGPESRGTAAATTTPPDRAAWRTGLNMLTQAILDEAEVARTAAGNTSNPYGDDDEQGFGYGGRGGGNSRLLPINSEELNRLLPDDRWLLAIDPGLAAKLELLVASTQGTAGDTASVLELIRPVAAADPARALKLAEALLKAWPAYTKRGNTDPAAYYGPSFGRFGGMYGGMFGGMFGNYGNQGGIPLTRAQQARHLAKLRDVIAELAKLKVGPLPAPALVEAFASCHSSAEVYSADDVASVFGPAADLSFELRLKLADGMRKRLGGMWRSQQVQEQAGTKRAEQEVAKEVIRGYDLALAICPDAAAAKTDDERRSAWQGVQASADLMYDKAEYLFGRKVDAGVYDELRTRAFALYAQAAEMYTAELQQGRVQPSARAYSQWFNSSLGASDLGFMTRQDAPDAGQLDAVKAAMAAIPEAARKRHIELFAQSAIAALGQLNPELKHRYARQAAALLGDVPQARELRTLLAYYDDLTREVQLNLTVDGPTDVGREPFGAVLSVWSSVSVSRESGGFGRYLNPQDWDQRTGQQIDRREAIEKQLREKLAEKFEVVSITFSKPDVKPMPIAEGGREGWEQTVLAYILLKAKDSSTDKLPQVSLEMDFRDTTGNVLLPVASTPQLIDARAERGPQRPIAEPTLEIIIDDRAFARGTPNAKDPRAATLPGELKLEIKARAEGLVPDVDRVVDLASISGFEVASVEDRPASVLEIRQRLGRALPVSERSWTVTMRQTAAASAGLASSQFTPPRPAPAFANAKLELKRFADADVVALKPGQTITLAAVDGRATRRAIIYGVVLVAVAAVAFALFKIARSAGRQRITSVAPRFAMPQQLTPVTALALMRQIGASPVARLSPAEKQQLITEIKSLEQSAFSTDAARFSEIDLRQSLSMWIGRAG